MFSFSLLQQSIITHGNNIYQRWTIGNRFKSFQDAKLDKHASESINEDINQILDNMESEMLPHLFGHKSFRPGQKEVIARILDQKSSLAVFPTGFGKSLLYMLPSQLFDGITIVVSPLLALMRDQVEFLKSRGIMAVKIDGSMTIDEVKSSIKSILNHSAKILFVSPERYF